MEPHKKDIFGILFPQVLWAFLATTACDSPNQVMHWDETINFDEHLAASEKIFWNATNDEAVHEAMCATKIENSNLAVVLTKSYHRNAEEHRLRPLDAFRFFLESNRISFYSCLV